MKAMEYKPDTAIGFVLGLIGGCFNYMLQVANETPYFFKLLEAGLTAFICGALGVAGKYFFGWVKNKWQNRKLKIKK